MTTDKYILVTGGAGYIGSHTCKVLAKAGYTPVIVDNLCNGHDWALDWTVSKGDVDISPTFKNLDIRDTAALTEVFLEYQPLAVIHLAAFIEVGISVEDPLSFYNNNVGGMISLLGAMWAANVDKIVFSSSGAVYGTPACVPIPENAPLQPINPYGRTKAMCEHILQDADRGYGVRSVSLRYFNASGADLDGGLGETHSPETHLIPLALQSLLGQRPAFKVFGNDYETPDGTAVRDYIHVCDLGAAHMRAVEYLLKGGKTDAFNVGTGKGHSVREVLEAIQRVTGKPVPTEITERRTGDSSTLVADTTKSREILGFEPQCSDMDTIIQTAYDWHKGR